MAMAKEGFPSQLTKLLNYFSSAKVVETGAATATDGTPRGVIVIEVP
jgi:hypothetical protein